MHLGIFYNGTDSKYTSDLNIKGESVSVNRFAAGELVSRLGWVCKRNKTQSIIQINGVSSTEKIGGTLLGMGLEANVQIGLTFIRKSLSKTGKNTITIVGWSRGGITSMCLARAIKDDPKLCGARVTVIAFDPVAGIGCNIRGTKRKWYELKGIEAYHGFYAQNENSPGFAPTIPSVPDLKSRVYLCGVPGTHSTLVGNLKPGGGDSTEMGVVDKWGWSIYKKMVAISLKILRDQGLGLNGKKLQDWRRLMTRVKPTGIVGQLASMEEYRQKASETYLTTGIVDDEIGRGIWVAGNTTQRYWLPDQSLESFTNETNNHFSYFTGISTIMDKITNECRGTGEVTGLFTESAIDTNPDYEEYEEIWF